MSWSTLGLIVGFAAGLVLVFEGVWAFFLVLLLSAVGLALGRYADGGLDISRYVSSGRNSVRSLRRPRRGA